MSCVKKAIVFGIGITGKSAIKALVKLDYEVYVYDDRNKKDIVSSLVDIDSNSYKIIEDINLLNWKDFLFIIKSPGIKNSHEFLIEAKKNNVEIISDIELAYRIFGGDRFIAVTGTNGKTTITSLITHILKNSGIKCKSAGNIGVGVLYDMLNSDEETYYILEMSSFQLDATIKFRPKIAVISNITEDHIDWHGSFDDYKKSKYKIFKNQTNSDFLILNYDDYNLRLIESNSAKKYFSLKSIVDAYLDDDMLIFKEFNISKKQINLVGKHNISNILASCLAANEIIKDKGMIVNAVSTFKSIEHRIEYVTEKNGVKYYNDSKGTNVESTIVAIDSFDKNIILIAGGYDKNSVFDELFNQSKKIKKLILLGQTKEKIKKAALNSGLNDILMVSNMEEAIDRAKENAEYGDVVLFSPACASWDMYNNYEERGNHFKELVMRNL